MLKILGKGKEIISCDVMYKSYSNRVFFKNNFFQKIRKLAGFTLQARYLVKKFLLLFPHVALILLYILD